MNEGIDYRIRPAIAADMAFIRERVRRAGLDRTGLNWRSFLVAEASSMPAGPEPAPGDARELAVPGLLGFCQIRRYRGVRELGSLYVRKRYRGQGIGGVLVHACLSQAQPPVHLECVQDRQPFYEGFGFRRIPRRQAPWPLRLKSTLGTAAVWLLYRKSVIVMRWDG